MAVNKINFSVSAGGDSSPWFPTKCVTHDQIIKKIKENKYNSKVTAKLIKIAKTYPTNALNKFVENFGDHLKKAQGK